MARVSAKPSAFMASAAAATPSSPPKPPDPTTTTSPPSPPSSPLTMAQLADGFAVLQQLELKYGSARAGLQQLESLELVQRELMETIQLLKRKLRMTQLQADKARFDAEAFVKHLWRNFACRGDMGLLLKLIKHFQEHEGRPINPFYDGNLLVSVQEIADAPVSSSTTTPTAAASGPSPYPFPTTASSLSCGMPNLTPKAKSALSKRRRSPSPAASIDRHRRDSMSLDDPGGGAAPRSKKQRVSAGTSDVHVIQNLNLPIERRNVAEMKHSSQFVTFEALEELERRAPWESMYRQRPRQTHIIKYQTLQDAGKAWVLNALQTQFHWRREFWERLHWLPMSENVLQGPKWDKMRQTRKKRASIAVAAWRKVYNDSIDLIKAGILPEDVWCDPVFWYMPQSPLYWLPQSADFVNDQDKLDLRQPARVYYVHDIACHPFYQDGLVRKYPQTFELPVTPSAPVTSGPIGPMGPIGSSATMATTYSAAADAGRSKPPPWQPSDAGPKDDGNGKRTDAADRAAVGDDGLSRNRMEPMDAMAVNDGDERDDGGGEQVDPGGTGAGMDDVDGDEDGRQEAEVNGSNCRAPDHPPAAPPEANDKSDDEDNRTKKPPEEKPPEDQERLAPILDDGGGGGGGGNEENEDERGRKNDVDDDQNDAGDHNHDGDDAGGGGDTDGDDGGRGGRVPDPLTQEEEHVHASREQTNGAIGIVLSVPAAVADGSNGDVLMEEASTQDEQEHAGS